MDTIQRKLSVGACETQPIAAEGLKEILRHTADLQFLVSTDSLVLGAELAMAHCPAVMLVDKAFGTQPVVDFMAGLRERDSRTNIVVWGAAISEVEALRFLQSGARAVTRKTSSLDSILECLRAASAGRTWMEETMFQEASRSDRYPRSELTPREQQVMELVSQGMKNKDVAGKLGIRPGTVKIHLKHIFEKTGVKGRYGLALTGMRERGSLPMMTV